ncbi:cytochrome c oxidase subunit 3 [Marinobacterium sediminicola]|uniref:cytochrome-c oxidase n=1 Tax=Marinobacterium sediminicola TaxID=518898 RepID=A0ABY1S4M9_9GAMM|nr:cytochrome c oxidase subunit 3 [Marinobacterium sediminicola]ULG68929.1 cytochrome c oxidase subunit 3 [Marinobacterium sediminicola]SMR78432.1 cytochrome c oxidase subunit 3 [Marinobacterium sediminicola]
MSSSTYYVPEQSRWPILASIALFLLAYGAGTLLNAMNADRGGGLGLVLLLAGALMMGLILVGWFGNVIHESRDGLYSPQMDRSFRWGMSWFIFSEVMFFAAFFGALFYVRTLALPWLGGEGDKGVSQMLWPEFTAQWPLFNPPDAEQFPGPREVISPWHIPLLNTCLLVTSSFTLTLAHKALLKNERMQVRRWLFLTIVLGLVFLGFQAYEYVEAYHELGLTLQSGIYGATFFILTGFHGLHVTLGTLMLIIILGRIVVGHFSPRQHFGFEAVAWYWHFVDVVWIGLFLFVYVL